MDFDASVVSWSCHHTRTRPRNPASGSRLVATLCASPSPPRHPPPRRPHCGLIFGRTSRKCDCTVRNVLRLSVARVPGRLLSSTDSCSAAWSRHRCAHGTGAHRAQVRSGHRCAHGTGVHTAQVSVWHRCAHGTGVCMAQVLTSTGAEHGLSKQSPAELLKSSMSGFFFMDISFHLRLKILFPQKMGDQDIHHKSHFPKEEVGLLGRALSTPSALSETARLFQGGGPAGACPVADDIKHLFVCSFAFRPFSLMKCVFKFCPFF